MLNARHRQAKAGHRLRGTAARAAASARQTTSHAGSAQRHASTSISYASSGSHPLTRQAENSALREYETRVKETFDAIVPTLKQISALQHQTNFESQAQQIAKQQLGFELPGKLLDNVWVSHLDMRSLFAWCLFEVYKRFSDEFFTRDPLQGSHLGDETRFQEFLESCGFHTLDVSPCADGRLAHVVRYVMRLPYKAVRRKSYAGALFDVENSLEKWVETELYRFKEGKPNTADAPTRYLKTVVYHFSSVDPEHEGCAAHGSDTTKAAQAGIDRLQAFKQAVENMHCCGSSIDQLLVGLDTDTDAIRVHLPDGQDGIDLENFIDAHEMYNSTHQMSVSEAEAWIHKQVANSNQALSEGMVKLITALLVNNLSQIDYVRKAHGQFYPDAGHEERFIGAGIGFEEVQLRNLTYFAYLNTVEEAVNDLDVGIKIFTGLNISRELPVPVVIRFDYHGKVPGARERAIEHCQRVSDAMNQRYVEIKSKGLLHSLVAIRDISAAGCIEVLDCSVKTEAKPEAH